MKLLIDISKVQFSVTRNPGARNDHNGKQTYPRKAPARRHASSGISGPVGW
ncbi:hypothetical protein [Planosporangium mesophilum]|uniref:Uncharacterized protein n=1 Tax=Planosporangium mesophilum TaxID=689768 RepID=A0A8J3TD93_9ACTN|nr:hypothetical protein [Planosporangium mesophilum]NJC85497.1 hypothetical protein [Planosporangium mesophilum]GII24638.1 hypothetical protein Pme01_42350 [Planosporangium mesophilum]